MTQHPRVIGIDPGTVSIDLCGVTGDELWLDRTLPTAEALAEPAAFLALLEEEGRPDLIAGPSGYGLPLRPAADTTEADLRLALLTADGEAGGIGGLGRLMRLLVQSGLPVVFTPGVIHLATVPSHRKLNRIDMGTADKVAAAALGVWAARRLSRSAPAETAAPSFILLELGGAFTAALAVERGAIIDGVGGTGGPMGWQSGGGWDGETAFLAGSVTKQMLFRGGRTADSDQGLEAYLEAAHKAALSLLASLPCPDLIFLSGRHAGNPAVRRALEIRLSPVAPVHDLIGFAHVAKQGAQGAALIADGLAGGGQASMVAGLRLREAGGTVLDWLRVISPQQALAGLTRR